MKCHCDCGDSKPDLHGDKLCAKHHTIGTYTEDENWHKASMYERLPKVYASIFKFLF